MTLNDKLSNVNPGSALLAGIVGTSVMTAFSYFVSNRKGKYFKEPQLLNDLVYGRVKVILDTMKKGRQPLTGFLGHYATGILFSVCYQLLWRKKQKDRALGNGLGFGLTFGLLGITVWKTVFKLHPKPPAGVDLDNFLTHLIVAHLVYGEAVAITTSLSLENTVHGQLAKTEKDNQTMAVSGRITSDPVANTGKVL